MVVASDRARRGPWTWPLGDMAYFASSARNVREFDNRCPHSRTCARTWLYDLLPRSRLWTLWRRAPCRSPTLKPLKAVARQTLTHGQHLRLASIATHEFNRSSRNRGGRHASLRSLGADIESCNSHDSARETGIIVQYGTSMRGLSFCDDHDHGFSRLRCGSRTRRSNREVNCARVVRSYFQRPDLFWQRECLRAISPNCAHASSLPGSGDNAEGNSYGRKPLM